MDSERYRWFFQHSLDLLAVTGAGDALLAVNPVWESTLGWPTDDLISQPMVSFLHPDDAADARSELGRLRSQGGHGAIRARCRQRDGGYRWLQWRLSGDGAGTVYAVGRDESDLERVVAEARRNEELWRSVLTTAVDPIVLIDGDGVIVQANRATATLFGHGVDELVGRNVSVLMPEPYRREHDDYLARYHETGEARIIGIGREVEAQKADGTVFPIALAVSEVQTDGGRLYTGIIHDLTAQRQAAQGLREANEQLERRVEERTAELETSMSELARSNRDLEQFAYVASHDLQAPLRNVRQGLELLNSHLSETVGTGFDHEATELRELIVAAVDRMEDLIRGLLAYSRVDRLGQPVTSVVPLAEVTEEVLAQLRLDLDEAGARVEAETLPTVTGDPVQLRQLLQNLVQNAVKYRVADRPPEISISSTSTDDSWVISVADNGIGVDREQHDRIFELFRRAHPDHDGVGLGLAICQRIVERHGGEIWVSSEPDEGATFTFTLPKAPPEPEPVTALGGMP